MNALHKMQDHRQQTMVISQRRLQKTYTEQATSRTLMRPCRLPLKHVIVKKKRGFFTSKKMTRDRRSRDDLQRHHQRHSCKDRSARETRQDSDHEGGGVGDHGGRLLQDAPRSPRLSAEAQKEETSVKHKGLVVSCSMSGSEEWWFDVRPKGVGKKRRCTIDELCSESSESSSAPDATVARWYEAFETRVTASQSTHRSEWSSPSETKPREKGSRRSGVDQTRKRGIHCSFYAMCRSAGRRCFACCSRDARDAEDNVVGREHERVRIRMTLQNVASTVTGDQGADSRPMSAFVSPVYLVSTSGRLVKVHLHAEHRKRQAGTSISSKFATPTSAWGRTVKSPCSSK